MPRQSVTRRAWLCQTANAAATALSWPALISALGGSTSAGGPVKNLRLGIMSSVYGGLPVAEAASRIKADGFTNVICDLAFADARFDPLEPDWKTADMITSTLHRQGLEISSLFGYYNVVDPNTARRQQGEARMEALLKHGKRLGCTLISTETGTLDPASQWVDHPDNATEAAYLACQRAFQRLAKLGEKHGTRVGIEVYYRNIIRTIDRADRLFREVDSPALCLVMDPCNYYRKQDLPQMAPMLRDMFARLGARIAIAHAKDVKGVADDSDETELPAAGQGVLDYPLYLSLLAGLNRPIDMVLEHLKLEELPAARGYVVEKLAGVS